SRMWATTMPLKGGATGSVSSTSRPAMVRRWDSSSVPRAGLTNVRSQDSGNCMMCCQIRLQRLASKRRSAIELTQEAQIAFEELAQVVDAVTQHGQALES